MNRCWISLCTCPGFLCLRRTHSLMTIEKLPLLWCLEHLQRNVKQRLHLRSDCPKHKHLGKYKAKKVRRSLFIKPTCIWVSALIRLITKNRSTGWLSSFSQWYCHLSDKPSCNCCCCFSGQAKFIGELLVPVAPFDQKSGREAWTVAFAPNGSYFAWSQGHRIVRLIPWAKCLKNL